MESSESLTGSSAALITCILESQPVTVPHSRNTATSTPILTSAQPATSPYTPLLSSPEGPLPPPAPSLPSQASPPATPIGSHGLVEDGHRTSSVVITSGAATSRMTGVTVKAASKDQLIQMCVEAFNANGLDKTHEDYVTIFLLVHQWFMSSEELALAFIDLYQSSEQRITCVGSECEHQPANTECAVQIYKKSICQVFRYWICNFPLHFDLDSKVTAAVQRLSSMLQAEGNTKLKYLLDVSKIPSYDWMRNMSVRSSTYGKHSRKVSLVFDHLEPKELAEQLTYLEYKAFRRVLLSDYKNYAVTASLKDQPKLERSVALFNGLSQWVQCMVLSRTTPQQRADVICKFIDVSKNFNTLMSIVGGLSHSALARLTKTVSCLPNESQKTLMDLAELLSSNNNFSTYRKLYHQCKGFKIPILGVHLKDIISLHAALPDRVDGNLINFRKMTQLAVIVKELTRFQVQDCCPVDANMDLVNTLRLSLDLYHTEDEIYELSLAREPRGSLPSPTTPTKRAVFADWLSGISPPDPNIINKHVHDMVEAVFKNYDHDRDGFISHGEFDSIAGNFPFIDSFCVLDADKDGVISKEEMKTYFVRANCHALKNSFKHAFHETTYFKPTYCIHCTGLCWGLIKQGSKCKDCGINAHKHCKDLVVMECRSKGNRMSESLSSEMEPDVLTEPTKWKISQRDHKRSSPLQSCQQSTQTERVAVRRTSSLKVMNSNKSHSDGEYYEEQALLYERLLKAEEVREKLKEENSFLKSKLEMANDQISLLKSEIGVIRENTISCILEQMGALEIQHDTEL